MTPELAHVAAQALRDRGDAAGAANAWEDLLARWPTHAPALYGLGLLRYQEGNLPGAIGLLQRASVEAPEDAQLLGNLGGMLVAARQAEAATVCLFKATRLQPGNANAWHNLGSALRDLGRPAEAAHCYEEALRLQPGFALALSNLGVVLRELGRIAESVACLERAVEQDGSLTEAWSNLGTAHAARGDWTAARGAYERALALQPHSAPALFNLGNALRETGDLAGAARLFESAADIQPELAEVHLNLGNLRKAAGRMTEATECFRRAVALQPDFAAAWSNLGLLLLETGQTLPALEAVERALALRPDLPEAWNNLGNARKAQGRLAEALDAYAHAIELNPRYVAAHSNFLFTLAFVDDFDQAQIYELHRQWATHHAAASPLANHANSPDPERRLRIAYVSPDFRAHACAFFLEPLLRAHDRSRVEVFAYAEVVAADEVTHRLHGLVDVWRNTVGQGDEALVAQIRADGIDVLVDLAGHTANNRLVALSHKPAPVQCTWLGYPATTGLPAMDWRLTDAVAEPEGTAEAYYTERLMRLPNSLWCYQPPADMPPASASPALAKGQVTFGSFNNFSKIGPRVIALWAEVLKAVPESRLLMITVPEGEPREALVEAFEALGVCASRLALRGKLARADYVSAFAAVDIALDPFPCNGGTTTCDALWMGLPVVALRGNTFLSRASLSVLTAAGCPEFSAADEHDYVARCVALAADLPRLDALRRGQRERLLASPLLDAAGFARDIETAYRRMWRDWCATRHSGLGEGRA